MLDFYNALIVGLSLAQSENNIPRADMNKNTFLVQLLSWLLFKVRYKYKYSRGFVVRTPIVQTIIFLSRFTNRSVISDDFYVRLIEIGCELRLFEENRR